MTDLLVSKNTPFEAQNPVDFDTAAYAKVDSLCQGIIDNGNTPGVVLLIGLGDEILMRKAYGNRMVQPHQETMTIDTVFDLASITKASATASAVMLLVQDGVLSLDDPVVKYLPALKREDMPDITIKQLMTHTSGLTQYTNYQNLLENYGSGPNLFGLFKAIAAEERIGAPGEKYQYSCLNFQILSRIVHEVIGMNMEKFLRARLWDPLGMKETTFYPTEEMVARCAPTKFDEKEFRRGRINDNLAFYSICEAYAPGNAGVFSTADDMRIFVRMMLNGGVLDGVKIFNPEILELMTTNRVPDHIDTPRSCGWVVWNEEEYLTPLNKQPENCCLGHSGYTGTIIWMDKYSKAYVIMFTNCVYPIDKQANKDEIIRARKSVIRLVLDHLKVYEEYKGG